MYDQWLLRNALHTLRALDSAKNQVLTRSNQWIMMDHFLPVLLYLVVWFVVVAVSCLTCLKCLRTLQSYSHTVYSQTVVQTSTLNQHSINIQSTQNQLTTTTIPDYLRCDLIFTSAYCGVRWPSIQYRFTPYWMQCQSNASSSAVIFAQARKVWQCEKFDKQLSSIFQSVDK